MTDDVNELLLKHYGTRGMHWGVRTKSSQKESSDYKKTKGLRNKKTHELTNKQLQNVNARIKLEKTYRGHHPSKVAIGKAAVAGILGTASMAAGIYNLQHNPALKAMISAGASRAAKMTAKKAMSVPYEQLKLFK